VSAVEHIIEEFQHKLDAITIVPSKGGVFEVTLGDELIYSKKETGRHAEYEADIGAPLRERLG
jgi:selenoprotein W-related protein